MAIHIKLEENNIKSLQEPMEVEMHKAIKHFEKELVKIRTGRAHTSLIEDMLVSCYGQQASPLKNLAAIAAPEARLLTIQPWDVSIVGDIEKAIAESDLGLTPINDGKIIRLQLPQMTSARREELTKLLGKKLEECKVGIRNIRKEFNNSIRDAKQDKVISENFYSRLTDTLQTITDKFSASAEQQAEKKKVEITTI
jgi:ribosome recycling factor